MTTRFAGVNDEAGFVVRRTQAVGETLEEFAKDLADEFKDPIRAYKDAKECTNLAPLPDKQRDAMKAAEKALKRVPNQGLAEVCLAGMAKSSGQPADSVIAHLLRAVEGDPLSLPAYTMLAEEYEARAACIYVLRLERRVRLLTFGHRPHVRRVEQSHGERARVGPQLA